MSNLEQEALAKLEDVERRLANLEAQLENRVRELIQQHLQGVSYPDQKGQVDPGAVSEANQQFVGAQQGSAQQNELVDNGQLGQPNPGTTQQ